MDSAGGFLNVADPDWFESRVVAVQALVAELAAVDVTGVSNGELLGVLEPLERLRWSLDAVSSVVLDAADCRQVTLETAGNLTVSHITRICPQARAGVKRRIRNGHTLLTYPLFAAAHAAGSISTDHIAALGRVTNTRNRDLLVSIEPKLLALAAQLPFQRFVEALTYLAQHADADGPEPVDPETGRLRHVTHSDGVVDVQLRLSPVDGASFLELVEREADRLFHAYTRDRDMTVGETDIPSRSELLCEALMNLTTQGAAAGTTRQAPVTDLTLVERSHPNQAEFRSVGLDEFFADTMITTLTSIRLDPSILATRLENAVTRRMLINELGNPTHVTTPARFATAKQRNAIAVRDGGCVFPGCDCPINWCDLHHVQHYEHSGPTSIENLAPLCRRHHGITHTNGWTMTTTPNQRFVWTTPTGRTLHSQRHHTPPNQTCANQPTNRPTEPPPHTG